MYEHLKTPEEISAQARENIDKILAEAEAKANFTHSGVRRVSGGYGGGSVRIPKIGGTRRKGGRSRIMGSSMS